LQEVALVLLQVTVVVPLIGIEVEARLAVTVGNGGVDDALLTVMVTEREVVPPALLQLKV